MVMKTTTMTTTATMMITTFVATTGLACTLLTAGWSSAHTDDCALAIFDMFNAVLAQQLKLVVPVGDFLQGILVGHIFPEISPPLARCALEPVVGTKSFPGTVSEADALNFCGVGFHARLAQY